MTNKPFELKRRKNCSMCNQPHTSQEDNERLRAAINVGLHELTILQDMVEFGINAHIHHIKKKIKEATAPDIITADGDHAKPSEVCPQRGCRKLVCVCEI